MAGAINTAGIDRIFRFFDRPDTPGCAVAIAKNGEVIFEKGYGCADLANGIPITTDTIFHVASVSKQFTAFGITLLEEEGKLAVSDSIRRYVPGLPEFMENCTISHLLHHTSGLREQWDMIELSGNYMEDLATTEHVLRLLQHQKERNYEPGEKYTYCNCGYTLMGLAIRNITGKSLREFLNERVFAPLGMEHTWFRDNHAEINPGRARSYREAPGRNGAGEFPVKFEEPAMTFDLVGSTSLNTTAKDLLRWQKSWRDHTLGSAALYARMTEPVTLNNGKPSAYHRGVRSSVYRGMTIRDHTGANAGYRALVMAADEYDIVVLSNYRDVNIQMRGYAILDVLAGCDPDAFEPAKEYTEAPQTLTEGRYLGAFGTMTVRYDGTDLIADGKRYHPMGGNAYHCEETRGSIYTLGESLALYNGLTAALWTLLKPMPVTPAQKELVTGFWYSEELQTVYEATADDDHVYLTHMKTGTMVLTQARENFFVRTDKTNVLMELIDGEMFLTADRSTRLRFTRGRWMHN